MLISGTFHLVWMKFYSHEATPDFPLILAPRNHHSFYLLMSTEIFSRYGFHLFSFLDHMVVLILIIWEISILFSIVATLLRPHYKCSRVLIFPYSCQHFYILFMKHIFCIYSGHPNRCEVISHCNFDFNFPDKWCWYLLMYLLIIWILWNKYSSTLPIS